MVCSLRKALPLALLVASPLVARAQLASSAPTAPADTMKALTNRLKSDLRNLVTAQEARYAEFSKYALAMSEISDRAYRTSTGVTVEIVNGTPNGYGAVARTANYSGSCVIFIGISAESAPRTATEQKRFPEGEPACDGDGLEERARWASNAETVARRHLADIAKLQERQFGRTGAYASDLAQLAGYKPVSGTMVVLEVSTSPRGPSFAAAATDARYPGYSCVVRSGWGSFPSSARTQAERKFASSDLQVVCDTFK